MGIDKAYCLHKQMRQQEILWHWEGAKFYSSIFKQNIFNEVDLHNSFYL